MTPIAASPANLLHDAATVGAKMLTGGQLLHNLCDANAQIAATPKDLVWQRDKVSLLFVGNRSQTLFAPAVHAFAERTDASRTRQRKDQANNMPFSTRTDASIHYDIVGDGPALCLINGYRLSSEAWPKLFIERLSVRNKVILFDNRGTGRSTKPADGYEFPTMAADVAGLLDNLGLYQTHLLGFSMGGAIAQEVAIRYPDRVDRLVLFGTFCGGIWAEPASYDVFKRLLVTDGQTPEQAARQAWPVTYSPDYLATHAEAVEQQMRRELEHPTPMFVAARQMEALRKFDRYRDLPRIGSPTLVATGAEDHLVKPRNSAIIASRIPNARLELLADLGHRAIWEAPEEIADLVGDFLSRPIEAGQSAYDRSEEPIS